MAFPFAAVAGGLQAAGGIADMFAKQSAADKSWKHQKKFAQNAVQWRVADAVAAGLHPLAALGMPLASYAPEVVGGNSDFESMGQNLGRAMGALGAPSEKVSAQYEALQLENASLQNDKLRAEIAVMNQAGTPPGIVPSFGQDASLAAGVSNPNKNQVLQPHYGEGADMLTYPDLVYDLLRQPGNIANPRLASEASAAVLDAKAALDAATATLKQWYRPGGWNEYWR